ncbi:MAG: YdcF family protein [Spirochaetaceae bacterium]|nr:YdcF family protein [Spirochaetaceae bacterium]MCF7948010.1 YdcF family protein [Spirochaetia bacterium]MCF7951110.1 YdcF family protein [Spirochaetaceae bacterium]
MFSVSKVLTFLLLPPGIFLAVSLTALLLLLLSLRQEKRKTGTASRKAGSRLTRIATILMALLAAGLYTLSIEPVSELLLRPLEQAQPPLLLGPATPGAQYMDIDSVQADAIVVLSGGTVTRSPEEGGRAAPGAETLKRLSFGYRIHRASGLPLISTGGTPLSAGADETFPLPSAGAAMGRYLIALGADPEAVFTEETSRNTLENAALVAEKYDHQKVILVTSAYHMPRSVWIFKQMGFQVVPAPTDYKIDGDGYNPWSFFPSMDSLHDSYRALHEYAGIVYYLWQHEE